MFVRCVIFRGERRPRGVLQVVLQRQDVPGGREPGLRVGRESFCGVRAVASRGGDGGGDVRGDAVGDETGTRALRTGARLRGRGVCVRELAEILFVFVAGGLEERSASLGVRKRKATRRREVRGVAFSFFLRFWDPVTHRLHGCPGEVCPGSRRMRCRGDRWLALRGPGDEVRAVLQNPGRCDAVAGPPRLARVRHHLGAQRRGIAFRAAAGLARGSGRDEATRHRRGRAREARRIARARRAREPQTHHRARVAE